jgi:hypothetical protein
MFYSRTAREMKSARRIVALLALGLFAAGCAADGGPPPPAEAAEGLATLALDQRGELDGIAVTPLRIEEDSRCPTGVQCIQAGTVRVAIRIEERGARRETLLTLAQPVWIADGRALSLAAVCPYPRHPGAISPGSYRFTFTLGGDDAAAAAPACAP